MTGKVSYGIIFLTLLSVLLLASCSDNGLPFLSVSSNYINLEPSSDEKSFTLNNLGKGKLNWQIECDADWLELNAKEGTDKKIITVSVLWQNLTPGNYGTTLLITSNGGEAQVHIALEASLPAQVQNLDVRGITAPRGMINPENIQVFKSVFKEIDSAAYRVSEETAHRAKGLMPSGFEGGFVLSWEATKGALGYNIYSLDNDVYSLSAALDISQIPDPQNPCYALVGHPEIGESKTFKVVAYNILGEGIPSLEDTGLIIEPVILLTPAKGSTSSPKPYFAWHTVSGSTGYNLQLHSFEEQLIWEQIISATEILYPGDSSTAPPELAAGNYRWFSIAFGSLNAEEKTNSLSISEIWSFSVLR